MIIYCVWCHCLSLGHPAVSLASPSSAQVALLQMTSRLSLVAPSHGYINCLHVFNFRTLYAVALPRTLLDAGIPLGRVSRC